MIWYLGRRPYLWSDWVRGIHNLSGSRLYPQPLFRGTIYVVLSTRSPFSRLSSLFFLHLRSARGRCDTLAKRCNLSRRTPLEHGAGSIGAAGHPADSGSLGQYKPLVAV